jgi:hypothetical protein
MLTNKMFRSGDHANPRMAVETYKDGGIGQVLEFHSSIALNKAQVKKKINFKTYSSLFLMLISKYNVCIDKRLCGFIRRSFYNPNLTKNCLFPTYIGQSLGLFDAGKF